AVVVVTSSIANGTLLTEFAPNVRNTQGLRAHRMLRGETGLALAWAGVEPVSSTSGGVSRALPQEYSDRDASGIMLDSPIGVIGTGASPQLPTPQQAAEESD